MAFNVKDTLNVVLSHVQSSGYFNEVQIGEPKQPPATKQLFAAIWVDNIATPETVLNAPIHIEEIMLRVYHISLSDDPSDTELELAEAVSELLEDFAGDFQLGGDIRNVDFGGQYGVGVSATWGFVDIGGVIFRSVDILLPLVIDPTAVMAP